MSEAFSLLLSALLPDLVVLDPSDVALRALLTPVMEKELVERSPLTRRALAAGARLRAAGYHEQVLLRPGFLNLFWFTDDERRALVIHDSEIEVRGTERRITLDEAARLLREQPDSWSPSALLRPLVQDYLLPTAAYVAGPAEVAYHAQIGSAYECFGIPRPAVFPRPSATLLPPATVRAMESEGVSPSQVLGDLEQLLSRRALSENPSVDSSFANARNALEREMAVVRSAVGAVDSTLVAAAEATLGRAWHPIAALHEKTVRALKRREEVRAARLRRVREAFLPGGSLQERRLSFCPLVARHGPALIGRLEERLDLWARAHQVIEI